MLFSIVLACTLLTVLLNYEGMHQLTRRMERLAWLGRKRFLILIVALLLLQLGGVSLFAIGYLLIDLANAEEVAAEPWAHYLYLSVSAYSTVGFGDVVPIDDARLLAGVEAITGFMMITWSASLTFLEMQRHWRD